LETGTINDGKGGASIIAKGNRKGCFYGSFIRPMEIKFVVQKSFLGGDY
jgi:hypothetical protein